MAVFAELFVSDYLRSTDHDIGAWTAHYGPALRRFFGKRASECDLDDLVQEVFIRMQTHLGAIDDIERYLFRVARNVLISRYRSDKAHGRGANDIDGTRLELIDDLSPERIAIGRQEYARAKQAILDLPPRARAAFQFHRFDNLTYCAIANKMGISKEAVKELMHRAILRLSEALDRES